MTKISKNYGSNQATNRTRPSEDATSVTPNDSTDLTTTATALYIGGGGDVKVTTVTGTAITFVGLQDGSWFPVSVKRVWATGTSASNIIALHD